MNKARKRIRPQAERLIASARRRQTELRAKKREEGLTDKEKHELLDLRNLIEKEEAIRAIDKALDEEAGEDEDRSGEVSG